MRVILIGPGLSSALISMLLRREYGSKIQLVVYDKEKNIGGRMTTRYEDESNPSCSVDLGAQYLAVTPSNSVTTVFFQELIDNHVIELLDKQNTIGIPYHRRPKSIIYTVPRGIVFVVKYFFEQAGDVDIHLGKSITKIGLNSPNQKYILSTDEGQVDESDVVIVTIPIPQLLGHLNGSIAQLIGVIIYINDQIILLLFSYSQFKDENKEVKEKLAGVTYYSRFAAALFYPGPIQSLNVPWRIFCVYEKDHEFIRFLFVDNMKRNQSLLSTDDSSWIFEKDRNEKRLLSYVVPSMIKKE